MRYLLPAVLGALSLLYVDGVAAQDTPTCVPGCANTVRGQFTQYGCVSADDAACLCANANFGFGVRDCGQTGCGSTDVQVQAFLAGNFCQGQQLAFTPTGASAPPTSTPPATPGASESTAPPSETTPGPTSPPTTSAPSSETAPPSSSPPATGPPTTASSATTGPASVPTQPSAPPTGTPLHSNSTIPASKPTSPPPTTTSAASSTSVSTSSPTSTETSAAAPAGGLSQGAAIGIGVGVAGGVVAIAFAGVFFFLKNRSRTHDSFDISAPPPSSGRGQGAFEKYSNDLELVSNRYEDMVPRQQPRAMV
ncbi:hypothetical protein J3E69DRAFT_365964 [Trichoderma sp. SZMC 28015]|uniref:CFEM domain-containing protein n=1 Tax=Trichoderma lentiforme TaxID=1567552 RepID=A0A9P4X363_9HYPO|nr:hypothetical protein CFAM422_013103 [Trichoderma lentiforme]